VFADNAELQGTDPVEVARFTAQISPSASPGSQLALSLEGIEIQNSEDFRFQVDGTAGSVEVTEGTSPTSTPTSTPTPTQQTDATPTPSPTWKADYDRNGRVDEKDLLRLLQTWHQETTNQ
jgi:hypothetical protein